MPYVIPPAGVSACSRFAPTVFATPSRPAGILADDIDPATGEIRSLLNGIHPVDGCVIEAMRVVRESGAAVQTVGNRLRDIRKNDESAPKAIENELRRALQLLVDRGDIRIEKVVITDDTSTDGGSGYLAYTNLQSLEEKKAPL